MPARFSAVPAKTSFWLKLLPIFVCLVTLMPLFLMVETLWGASNLGYQVASGDLTIGYAWKGESIPIPSIRSVELLRPSRLTRIVGNNTPGLYTGRWSSPETGPLQLYATRLDSLVVVKTDSATWGLSPADPEGFRAAALSGRQGEFPVATPDGNPLLMTIPLFALVFVTVAGIWFLVRLLERFPRVLTYELGPEALVIETGWRPIRLPYAEINSALETTLKGWPIRVIGSELKGVHWGSFSWSAVPGKRINLYATQLKPIVLIRAGKRSFGLSPADVAGFVGALRERLDRS